jgi:hypothetical protein
VEALATRRGDTNSSATSPSDHSNLPGAVERKHEPVRERLTGG